MNLMEVTRLCNGPILQIIQWLQRRNLLASPLRCAACNQAMQLTARNPDHVDGFQWRCQLCRRKKSLRDGSFFEEFPRLPLGKIVLLIYLWSMRELRTTASNMLSLSKNSVGNVYAVLRYHCRRDLQDRPIIPFNGNVYVVKCDESQFKHKSKYQRGRRARNNVWVFGVICANFRPCRGYFEVVERRDRITLTQILQRVLLPGAEVHTDDWGAYRNLHHHVPNITVHRTVTHQNSFVDPVTGVHTQEAESAWARLKYHIKREKGIRKPDIQAFLDEQMWRDWKGLDSVFDNMLVLIPNYYPL
ncbi:uncharacterized protein LOC122957226 [Acropora millepora]|uniref:uncharacterized protein LOC122957226 n=1 Tax=Acropora millepora TaxID=45264 RepID=UPI001CF51F00|nr:uncharacterized protein LOC122957226 [Acropora millepora]